MEQRIDAIGKEVNSLKEKILSPTSHIDQQCNPCKECAETFEKNFELENHMVDVHGCKKSYSCDICGKKFYLQWRRKKTSTRSWTKCEEVQIIS